MDELKKRIADPAMRKKIAGEIKVQVMRRNGRTRLDYVVVARCNWDNSLDGKNITAINKLWGRKPHLDDEVQTVIDMVDKGGAQMIYHGMTERDVERILQHPYVMIASDGGVVEMGAGMPHPRSYGTNARVLGRYVRERRAVPLEEAVRKMTSLPAQRFHLLDRGVLRPGMWADVVVFDDRLVADAATFEQPHAHSKGFSHVLVNGRVVIQGGRHTKARPGRVLLGPGVTTHGGNAEE